VGNSHRWLLSRQKTVSADSEEIVRTGTDQDAGITHVHLAPAADRTTAFGYFVRTPEGPGGSGAYSLGPVGVKRKGDWVSLSGTTADAFVAPGPAPTE
jgi:hypothetical protein